MEIDCCINCFSPELNGSLGVNLHRAGVFSDCSDYAFGNTIFLVSVCSAWLVCCSLSREDISDGVIVVFSSSIITPESLDLVSH